MSKELATGQKAGEAIKAGTDAAAIAAISVLIGFPLPPTLAMNIITALGTLVTSSLDVPTAYLQALATRMRAEGAAKAEVVTKTAKIAVKTIGEDDELAEHATLYLGGRMLREQTNREEVVAVAVNQLRAEPAPDGGANRRRRLGPAPAGAVGGRARCHGAADAGRGGP